MDSPQLPTDSITTAALASVVTAILVWVSGKGWPVIKEWLGLMSVRDKEIAASAKEGPLMVLEEVKRQLAETKAQSASDKADHYRQLAEVLVELKEMRKQHHDCETKHAALQSEVQFLRKEVEELRGEQRGQ